MIEFYSYENWRHEYARVHIGGCRFCNHGRGLFGGGRTPNGEWHGPFRSTALARGAVSNRVSDIQDCSFCTPREFDFSDDSEPEPGDTVIELRDGAVVIYEAGYGVDEAGDNEDVDVPSLPSVATDASTTATVAGGSYNDELVVRMHSYARERFDAALFEPSADPHRPPVFLAEHADSNLLRPPDAELASSVVTMVPRAARHRWFRSMKSSQALTQSVFGALAATGHLAALGALTAECGRSAFTETPNQLRMTLEQDVTWLGEPRPTSIDVCFESPQYRIAVECKLSESAFGTCSRPRLPQDDPSHCDGTYTVQHGRQARCALTERGVQYWQHAPAVLDWNPDVDHSPCPLARTYQLVRNVLAATVHQDRVETASGHALIIYDERNPAFWPGGDARRAYDAVCADLRHPGLLRTVSWQRVIGQLSAVRDLRWLVDELEAKYGLTTAATRSRHR